ncbi:hypothetical protein [Longispora fulva]|uniref:Uncharacterized protein n=1 Tax=Longispora fulva TaxID=619741 RepID=A0A8J7KIM0_9ACTN|nr:hypothetical protein [Longispora fulva]MBG6134271.1 hypothetical protein [Longispora fulva]
MLASTLGCSPAPRPAPQAAAQNPVAFPAPQGPAKATATNFCAVKSPESWTRATASGTIGHAPGENLFPVAVAPDGSSLFAEAGHGAAHMNELIWLREHGTRRQTVFTLQAPYLGFGQMDFDGRWLVFAANKSQDVVGAWDLFAWDSAAGGAPHMIAHDDATAPGAPLLWPAVRNGTATWIQATPDASRQVHLYTLAGDVDRIVHTGHLASPILVGDLAVWPESTSADAPGQLTAVSVSTGAPAALPATLAAIRKPASIASDGTTWVWSSADSRTLSAWRAGWAAPVTVRTVDGDDAIDGIHVAGDLVTWTGSTATYAADLRSRSFTQMSVQYGAALGNGRAITVSYPDGEIKADSMTYVTYVLAGADLPALPTC